MILVTGAAGFIGSNLVAALEQRGDGPVAVCDRFGDGDKWRNLASRGLADIVDPEDLATWLEVLGGEVECVFHMGASSSTTERDVDHVLESNFGASMLLFDWCVSEGKRLIYASSAAVYGDGAQGFHDRMDKEALSALLPLNAYGWSKLLFDKNVVRLAAQDRAPPQWAGLRFFNVYGPNEYHKGPQRSVPVQLFEQIETTGKSQLFKSHNPEYPDGGQMRDFVWVGDCVDVLLWLYDNPRVSGIFNCGTGEARTFEDLAKATFAAMNRKPQIEYIDTPADVRGQYQYFTQASLERLRVAGYDRPFTLLEDGVAAYVQDYLVRDNPYR